MRGASLLAALDSRAAFTATARASLVLQSDNIQLYRKSEGVQIIIWNCVTIKNYFWYGFIMVNLYFPSCIYLSWNKNIVQATLCSAQYWMKCRWWLNWQTDMVNDQARHLGLNICMGGAKKHFRIRHRRDDIYFSGKIFGQYLSPSLRYWRGSAIE